MARPSRPLASASRLIALTLLLAIVGAAFGLRAPAADAQEPAANAQPAGQSVNVELILDSSGSMAGPVAPGQPRRIDAAKQVLNEVVEVIPEDRPELNVGFRVFGLGTNTEAGRAESCQTSELRLPIEGVNKEGLRDQVAQYQPAGWTPIALSLQRAAEDFEAFPAEEGVTNAVILVTDGLETCSADVDDQEANNRAACDAAQALADSPGSPTVYVIGLGLNQDELEVTRCIADLTGGQLLGALSVEELRVALFTFLEQVQVVATTGSFEVESIGGLFPAVTLVGGTGATDANPQGEEIRFQIDPATGINRIDDIPVGVYEASFPYPSGEIKRLSINIEANRLTTLRGSILMLPQGTGEIYAIRDQAGVLVWQDQLEQGTKIWVLPDQYSIDILEVVGTPILLYARVQTLPGQTTTIEVFVSG